LQAQQTIALQRRPFSTMVAVVATVIAAALALALVVSVAGQPASSASPTVVTLHGVGAEQISHNRSDEGLGGSSSVGGQQIAHNRSEEGL
jgi:hypothetical protein